MEHQSQWAAAFAWCLRCERVFPTVTWIENDWRCPNLDCSADIGEAREWGPASTLLIAHPEYPEIPASGEHYPL